MAYVIIADNQIYRIASNETEKNQLNINETDYIVKEISDADFLRLRKDDVITSFANDTLTITNKDEENTIIGSTSEEIKEESIKVLKQYHEDLIKQFDAFLIDDNNSGKSLYSTIQSYRNYLSDLDYDSLAYPLNKTWEQYCHDNSISYISALQIP